MEQNKRLLNPKLDVVFQALFGEEGSEGITKSFLRDIRSKNIKNTVKYKSYFKKKKTR